MQLQINLNLLYNGKHNYQKEIINNHLIKESIFILILN